MTLVDITIVLSLWGADFESLRWIPCGFCALVSLISLARLQIIEEEKSSVSHVFVFYCCVTNQMTTNLASSDSAHVLQVSGRWRCGDGLAGFALWSHTR